MGLDSIILDKAGTFTEEKGFSTGIKLKCTIHESSEITSFEETFGSLIETSPHHTNMEPTNEEVIIMKYVTENIVGQRTASKRTQY